MGDTPKIPVSAMSSAHDKAHSQSASSMLPIRARRAAIATSSKSVLSNVSQHIRHPFRRSETGTASTKPFSPAESPFFRLPFELREIIYALLYGQRETFHILMKHRPFKIRDVLVHRVCRAGGNLEACALHDCKSFPDEQRREVYSGSFDNVAGLLFACQDLYREVSAVLYTQNTFEFSDPSTLLTFSATLPPTHLQTLTSLSINLQPELYTLSTQSYGFNGQILGRKMCDESPRMWEVISAMQGLRSIKVRFRFLRNRLIGWNEEELLRPLWLVTRPLRVFEVDSRNAFSFKDKESAARAPFRLLGSAAVVEGLLILASFLHHDFTAANLIVHNWCTFDLYSWYTTGSCSGASPTGQCLDSTPQNWNHLPHNSATKFQQSLLPSINLKVSKTLSETNGIIEFEYTANVDLRLIFWDRSLIDGTSNPPIPGNILAGFNVLLSPSGDGVGKGTCAPVRCDKTIGNASCPGAYWQPNDVGTRTCPMDTGDFTWDLCIPDAHFNSKRSSRFMPRGGIGRPSYSKWSIVQTDFVDFIFTVTV